jgi:SAM-dependent methyltransferase
MQDKLSEISTQMIERYSERYHDLGYDVRTLGWGSVEQQAYRFEQTLEALQSKPEKEILDIGCGFGDYLATIKASNYAFQKYIGWDLNPDLIQEAQKIWKDTPNVSFQVKNLNTLPKSESVADIGVMLGVLNLNLSDKLDNYEYSKKMISTAFGFVRELLVVDFLSLQYAPNYPKEDFVFYHDPLKMLEFAFELTPNVLLKHNYAPIPQREFMLYLYK